MKRRELRIERFLGEIESIVPWRNFVKEITLHYKSTKDRRPYDLEIENILLFRILS